MAAIEESGGGGHGKGDGKVRAKKMSTRVDMTPMVDLGFLLITFFMLATTMSKPTSMSLAVPDKTEDQEKPTEPLKASKVLTLFMGANDDVYYLDGIAADDDKAKTDLKTTRYGFDLRSVIFASQKRINAANPKDKDGNEAFVVVIKPTAVSTYKNMVDVLDEMAITKTKRYALVDQLTDAEKTLLGDKIIPKTSFNKINHSAMAEISPNATLDDIVFADRNKAYGAFSLRQGYRRDVTKATLLGAALFVLAMFTPSIINSLTAGKEEEAPMVEVDLMKIPPPPIDPAEPPPPPPPPVEAPKVNTVKFLPPEVKKDEEVPEEVPPPTVEEIKEAVVADKTIEGDPNANEIIVAPEAVAAPSKGTVVEAAPEPEKVFTVVEQQPEFPGGTAEMYKYLGKNIKYPSAASRANVSGRVFMSFVVNTDGSIQDVQVLKGLGFGCDEEAIRVVKAMPKWKPGKQSGRAVRVKYNLPINFQLE